MSFEEVYGLAHQCFSESNIIDDVLRALDDDSASDAPSDFPKPLNVPSSESALLDSGLTRVAAPRLKGLVLYD